MIVFLFLFFPYFVLRSKRMEVLLSNIEKVAEKAFSMIFMKNPPRKSMFGNEIVWQGHEITGTLCCLYKNSQNFVNDDNNESLRHEVIRMLVRRNDHSHALCLHFCGGSNEFHVYSKKGWVSFIPQKDALVITIGDQIQVNLICDHLASLLLLIKLHFCFINKKPSLFVPCTLKIISL